MAIKWPLANGNWSNAANWNDGTLPDVGDDVHADGKTVTIDQDVTVLSIRNDLRSDGTTGGTFEIGSNLATYNITSSFVINSTVRLLNASFDNKTLNFIGNFSSIGATATGGSILFSGEGCVISIVGNINQSSGTITNNQPIIGFIGSTTNISITGNVFSISGGVAGNSSGWLIGVSSANTSLLINGIVKSESNCSALRVTTTLISFIISGILQAPLAFQASNRSTLTFTSANNILYCDVIQGSTDYRSIAVVGSTSVLNNIIFKEMTISITGGFPIELCSFKFNDASIKITGYRANGTQFILSDGVGDANFIPNPANVRSGITYNLDQNTGTLVLPTQDNVRKGVVYDNFDKTGTADLTAEDFNQVLDDNIQNLAEGILQAIQDSTTPLAERLRNVSTVQTTGDQIAGS
jgi:hypothetical protein